MLETDATKLIGIETPTLQQLLHPDTLENIGPNIATNLGLAELSLIYISFKLYVIPTKVKYRIQCCFARVQYI